ncbi:MAG: hypothetical protein K2K00_06795 [Muribaculaceae bacterium]|nr:hypothetical protein [Muribaculaceae bacterium]
MKISDNIFSRLALLLSGVVIFFSAVSCNHDEPDEPLPAEVEETGRTVLVYMLSSKNGLGSSSPYDYDIQDINEMVAAAKEGDITDGRLLVFHSASNGNQVLKEITAEGKIDTLKIYDTALVPQSVERMSQVLDDMTELSPARDYGLILWGHGTGWIEDGLDDSGSSDIKTYSYGSENNNSRKMNITSMATVLDGRGFGFIYFDCCYMASVEVAYQLRHVTPRLVVYPTEILAYGMPYDRNIKHFFAPEPELKEAARNTFDLYDNMTPARYRMCTVSVLNTAGLDRLAAVTRAIYANNSTGVPSGYTPQRYTTSGNHYYCDFGGYIGALKADEEQRAEFEAAMAEVVELELATERIWNTLSINEHSGLSTFIMDSDNDASNKNYNRLDWFADVASSLIH